MIQLNDNQVKVLEDAKKLQEVNISAVSPMPNPYIGGYWIPPKYESNSVSHRCECTPIVYCDSSIWSIIGWVIAAVIFLWIML